MENSKKRNVTGKGVSNSTETAEQPLRFAHPYFSPLPPEQRPKDAVYGRQMLDHIKVKLHKIPPLKRATPMTLADVIGQEASDHIAAAKQITFHVAGDTGVPETDHETNQVLVAEAMAKDYDPTHPDTSPAFFLHLGDVIYGSSPDSYFDQFYRPYIHYPGKIIAIPGNHDGETNQKMNDFLKYFCADNQAVPPIAGSIFRQTMNQPGVYWYLDAPFVQIIGLYSNSAENPGFISGSHIGQKQKQWLVKTLKTIKASRDTGMRKALIFATHHPPYSTGGHSGSSNMLKDIDDACETAEILPDAFFSGHAHSIQRYTRSVPYRGKTVEITYVVSGCGGHGGQTVAPVNPANHVNPSYNFSYKGWGFTTVKITSNSLSITSYGVDSDGTKQLDNKMVNLS
jgi:hypothetical protein